MTSIKNTKKLNKLINSKTRSVTFTGKLMGN
jgi:hypothetical protein